MFQRQLQKQKCQPWTWRLAGFLAERFEKSLKAYKEHLIQSCFLSCWYAASFIQIASFDFQIKIKMSKVFLKIQDKKNCIIYRIM